MLRKQKYFKDPQRPIGSRTRHLTLEESQGASEDGAQSNSPIILREEDDEDNRSLQDIPAATQGGSEGLGFNGQVDRDASVSDGGHQELPNMGREHLQEEASETLMEQKDQFDEDKKRLVARCSYDGYAIYGRILCLVVKRRLGVKDRPAVSHGPAMMEDWIASTQVGVQDD